jgi:hypothetical protein
MRKYIAVVAVAALATGASASIAGASTWILPAPRTNKG